MKAEEFQSQILGHGVFMHAADLQTSISAKAISAIDQSRSKFIMFFALESRPKYPGADATCFTVARKLIPVQPLLAD